MIKFILCVCVSSSFLLWSLFFVVVVVVAIIWRAMLSFWLIFNVPASHTNDWYSKLHKSIHMSVISLDIFNLCLLPTFPSSTHHHKVKWTISSLYFYVFAKPSFLLTQDTHFNQWSFSIPIKFAWNMVIIFNYQKNRRTSNRMP